MPWRDRLLVARALFFVVAFRVSLWVIPSSYFTRLTTIPREYPTGLSEYTPEHMAWIVRAVARRVPYATCLTRALALRHLLAKAGYPAEIRIGVAKGERGLDSHAWVVCHGQALAEVNEDLERYEPILPSLGARRA